MYFCKMKNRALYNWLEYEWRISNAPKYQQYFKECVENLTEKGDAELIRADVMNRIKIK